MGDLAIGTAQRSGALTVLGQHEMRRRLGSWLRLSPYAPVADARRASHRSPPEHSGGLRSERSRS
jgi:hypothetical protein